MARAEKRPEGGEKRPREAAVRILARVLTDGQALDEAMAAELLAKPEIEAHRAWLMDITSGTLRWKGRLDLVLDSIALKKKPTGWLRRALLIGSYQLLAQERTPAAAAVSETVSMVRAKEGDSPSKFANALLRKVSEHAERWRNLSLSENAKTAEAARWASLPEWLWLRLESERGRAWAAEYARTSLERPTLWVRMKEFPGPPHVVPDWAEPGPIPGAFKVTSGGAIPQKGGFEEGIFFVQDISSQLLIEEVTREVQARLGVGTWKALDLCAAPGGKSVGLAWNGFQVTSSDRDPSRMMLLRQTADRMGRSGARFEVIEPEIAAKSTGWDLVWVDSPCTGTGILRRHPEVRWLRNEAELKGLLDVQKRLLEQAWNQIRPGGLLAYSVCSVLKEEGPGALERAGLVGKIVKDWNLEPQSPPHGDGFFCAILQKD